MNIDVWFETEMAGDVVWFETEMNVDVGFETEMAVDVVGFETEMTVDVDLKRKWLMTLDLKLKWLLLYVWKVSLKLSVRLCCFIQLCVRIDQVNYEIILLLKTHTWKEINPGLI